MSFTVFPNPGSDWLQIELEHELDGDIDYQIIDGFGRVLLTKRVEFDNKRSPRIDLVDLESGMYYLRLNRKNRTEFRSFVKL